MPQKHILVTVLGSVLASHDGSLVGGVDEDVRIFGKKNNRSMIYSNPSSAYQRENREGYIFTVGYLSFTNY